MASLVRKVFFHDDHKVVVPVYSYGADDLNIVSTNSQSTTPASDGLLSDERFSDGADKIISEDDAQNQYQNAYNDQ